MVVPPNTVHSSTFEKEYERIYISGEFNRIFNLHTPTVVLDNPQEEGTLLAKMIPQLQSEMQHPDLKSW